MMGKYKAAFLLPHGAKKYLNDEGWNFQSTARISNDVIYTMKEKLGLKFIESYFGIDSYSNDVIKMSVIFDDNEKIEQISFQLYNNSLKSFKKAINLSDYGDCLELFIPDGS